MKRVTFFRPVFSLSVFIVFLLCLPLLATHISLAQNAGEEFGEIQGKVSDAETGEPIPFVSVSYLLPTGQVSGAQTDFDGYYSLKPVPKGEYKLTFSFVGYKTQTLEKAVVKANIITYMDIKMKNAGTTLQVVELYSYRVGIPPPKPKPESIKDLPTRSSPAQPASASYWHKPIPKEISIETNNTTIPSPTQNMQNAVAPATKELGEIQGIVMSDKIDKAFVGVKVVAFPIPTGSPIVVQTDFDSFYCFKHLPKGVYTVTFSFPGYETQTFEKVVVNADRITYLDVNIEGSMVPLQPIKVR